MSDFTEAFEMLERRKAQDLREQQALACAERAYLQLLSIHPDTHFRIAAQPALCALRDLIAQASGRTDQNVQETYEEIALLKRLAPWSAT